MKVTMPKKEINKIIKLGREYHPDGCSECYCKTLRETTGASCKYIVKCLCGKTPVNCSEAIRFLRDFLKKFKQNKI